MRSSIDIKNLPPLNVTKVFYGGVRTLEKGGEKFVLNRKSNCNLQSLVNLREKAQEHEKSIMITSSSNRKSTSSAVNFKDESPAPPKKPIPKSSYAFTPIIPSPVNRKITRIPASGATKSICENFYENLNTDNNMKDLKLKSKSTNNLLSPTSNTKWPDPPLFHPRPPSTAEKPPQAASKSIKSIITNNPSSSIKARSSNASSSDHGESELRKVPKQLGPYISEPKFSLSRKMIIENGTNTFRPTNNSWRVVNNNGNTINGANSVAKIFTKHNGMANKYGTVGARVDNSAFMNELMANLNLIDFNYPNNSRRYKRPPLQQQIPPAVVNSSPMSRGGTNYINSATIGKPLQLQPQPAFTTQATPLIQPVPLRYNHMQPAQISHHNHTQHHNQQHKSNCPIHPRTQRPANRHSHHHVSPHCANCRENHTNHVGSASHHHNHHQHNGQRWPSMGTLIDDDLISNGTVRRRVASKSAAGHRSRCNSKSYFNDDPSNHEDEEIVIDNDSSHDNMSPKPTYVMHRSRKSRAQSIDSKLAKALANDPSLLNTSRHSSSNSITRISPMMDYNRGKGSEAAPAHQSKNKRQVKNGSVNSRFKVEEIVELNNTDEKSSHNNPLVQSSSASSKSTSSDYVKELKTQLENLKNEVTRLQTAQTSLEKSLKETTSIFKPMVLGGDENGIMMNPGDDIMSHFQFDQFLSGRMSHHAGSAAYMYSDDITNATSAVSTANNELGGYKSAEDLLNDKSLFYGGSFIDQSYLKYLPSSNGSHHATESQGRLNDPTFAVSAPIYLPPTIIEPKSLALEPGKHLEASTDNKATKLVNEISSSTIKSNNNTNKNTMLSASLATILSRPSINASSSVVPGQSTAAVSTKTSNNNANTTSSPSSLAAAFNSTFTSTNNCLSNIINGKIGSQTQVTSVSQHDQQTIKPGTKLEIPLSKLIVENQSNVTGSSGCSSPAYTIRPGKPMVHQRQPIVGKVASGVSYNRQIIDREILNRSPNSQLYEKLLKMISDSSDLNLTYEMNGLLANPVIKSRLKRLHQQLLQNPNHLLPKFESIIKNDFQSISPNSNSNTNESVTQQDLIELKNYYSKFAETNGTTTTAVCGGNVAKVSNVVVVSNPSVGVSSQANSYSMSRLIDREFKRR